MKVRLYDTTLRDGAQQAGISFSVEDKVKVTRKLAGLGIEFIEGGWPGASPKDTEFFQRMRDADLKGSTLVAFGSTRRPQTPAKEDSNLRDLLASRAKAATLVGKGSSRQVTRILKTSLEENLKMITESIRYLKSKGLTVFFDAEHYFDGYRMNPEYSRRTIESAAEAGADAVILCDTNGGTLPADIAAIVSASKDCGATLGIHAHNDSDLAVANTLAAVQAGAIQVQGTINGYGERCGNANLCSIIPALQLKMDIECLTPSQLARLTEVSRYVSEIANLPPDSRLPYVGTGAFGHKAGMHISAMVKSKESYQHIDPSLVGNDSRLLVSELSGTNTIIYKASELGLNYAARTAEAKKILRQIKSLENQGYSYEDAGASFELLLQRASPDYRPPFELVDFMVVVERYRRLPSRQAEGMLSEAMVKVRVGDAIQHTAAEGNGPVNALDEALRKALTLFYPELMVVRLIDYRVRILEESEGTESTVRVLIESSDGGREWRTVGSSANIIEASWIALADSLEYWLLSRSAAGKPAARKRG